MYYDQPLVGTFEQNAFTMPPIVNNVTFTNPTLSNPASGQTSTTTGVRTIIGTATDFKNPRMMQWNIGVARRLWSAAAIDVSYVGSRGDNLIRPTDINLPQPAAVVALQAVTPGAVNAARPFQSYGTITYRETTARSRYHGLLTSFKYEGGERGGSATLNYTLSRNRTDATNDRDAVDIPQNPLNPDADYADARTDRRHIFNASYIYELPFFRSGGTLAKAGTFGNSGRAPFRQPGRHQWDINLSKNFYPTSTVRVQVRAELINAFDQRQWLADPNVGGIDNTCTVSTTTCQVASDRFGQLIATRSPREIQLGLKVYW